MSETRGWEVKRSRQVHLSEAEIAIVTVGYRDGRTSRAVAAELKCSIRTINAWFAKFRAGWRPGALRPRFDSERQFTGPVKKKPTAAPNALPHVAHLVTGGRAR